MPTKNKYESKNVWWDEKKRTVIHKSDVEIYRCKGRLKTPEHYVRFDSQHEFKVYLELIRMFDYDRIVRQHKIELLPPSICYPKGKTWRVDFAIKGKHKTDEFLAYVEAKGAVLSEFCYTLGLLESNRPIEFSKLRIVFPRQIPKDSKLIQDIAKTSYSKILLTLPQLKTLNHFT